MNFSSFAGNHQVKRQLADAFKHKRFPHAAIFQGAQGSGKRTLAKHVAKALVCQHPHSAPCGDCPSCIRADAGSHPDIRIEAGSGNAQSISVDSIKRITTDAYRMPEEANVNVFLLFIQGKMSEAAQDKLLKCIEEPPGNTVFMLTCGSAQELLPTIRSRAQTFTLLPPTIEEAAAFYAHETNSPLSDAESLAWLCGGNIGQMFEEGDKGFATQAHALSKSIAQYMLEPSGHNLLAVTAPLAKDRPLFQAVLSHLRLICRDACVTRVANTTNLGGGGEAVKALQSLSKRRIGQLFDLLETYRQVAMRNVNLTLLATVFCADLQAIALDGETVNIKLSDWLNHE